MQYLGDLLLWVLGVITGLLMVAVVKTLLTKQKVSVYQPSQDEKLNLEYAEKLSEMIKYETVSHPENPEIEKFRGFHKVLEKLFPLVHEKLEKTEIDGNLLY